MKDILLLDLLEIGLLNLSMGDKKETTIMRFGTILKQLHTLNYLFYAKTNPGRIIKSIKMLFPIYKNTRAKTKAFKIRRKEIDRFMKERNIILRPLDHVPNITKKEILA
ncbi:MAG: hypothetical protein ACYS1A_10875 [Planctomycetota bacterium]|jgi:hypothetical protein